VDEGTEAYEALCRDWSNYVESTVIPMKQAQFEGLREGMKNRDLKGAEHRKLRERVREIERDIASWRVPPPPIENFFYVAWSGGAFMGCSSKNPELVRPLENVLNSTGYNLPDAFAIFFQNSIFKFGSGNSVDIEIRGDDLEQVVGAATNMMMACSERFGRPEANPPNFALDRREDQFYPDRVRAGELGLSVTDIGAFIRACGDGRVVGQYREAGLSIDLAIKMAGTEDPTTGLNATRAIAQTPIYAPTGQIVPLSAVCNVSSTTAPQRIDHIETQRAVKLTVRPPEGLSLPEVIDPLRRGR
jgi:HAE1 family hydrophobic/amphiphilic exporter-1